MDSDYSSNVEESVTEFVSLPHLHIKDEPQDDPEMTESALTLNSCAVTEIDPMNLLELVDDNNDDQSDSEQTLDDDEVRRNSIAGVEKWEKWMQKCPWLLHEDDEGFGCYCLYCGVNLVVKVWGHLRHHESSFQHKEREEAYTAFKLHEEKEKAQQSSPTPDIKQEFDTRSNIADLKLMRTLETELLNNFGWSRWLEVHKWLERRHSEGTVGYCKYCKMNLNVEFAYIRERHETSVKHKEAEKLSQMSENYDPNSETDRDQEEGSELPKDGEAIDPQIAGDSNELMEMLSNEVYLCKLCNKKLSKQSFNKHLKTKIHARSLRYLKKGEVILQKTSLKRKRRITPSQKGNWKMINRAHPWLIVDPTDASYYYCKFCEKRFVYGMSEVKRMAHENGIAHKYARTAYEERQAAAPKSTELEVVDAVVSENEEQEYAREDDLSVITERRSDRDSDYNDGTNTDKRTPRVYRGSDEWYSLIPWCEKSEKDPNYAFCIYCDVLLALGTLSRAKHEKTARHRAGEEIYFRKLARKANTHIVTKDRQQRYFPWLVVSKKFPNRVFCKYCRVRFSAASSRIKHENTKRHKLSASQYLAKESIKSGSPRSLSAATPQSPGPIDIRRNATDDEAAPHSMQARIMMWKNRFQWLTYKRSELCRDYAYCKYCEQRVFVPTSKIAAKHQKSVKHIRSRMKIRRQRVVPGKTATVGHASNEQTKDASLDEYPWIMPDIEKQKDYGFCKYCETRLFINGNHKKKHQASQKHIHAEKVYMQRLRASSERNSANAAADAIVVDDVEDQDVKSISLAEEDEPSQIESIVLEDDKSDIEIIAEGPPEYTSPKRGRPKSHEVAVRIAKNLTEAHTKLLRLSQTLGDQNKADEQLKALAVSSSAMASPMSIDACLNALAQQITKSQAQNPPPPPPPTPERNTFDLFFESVCSSVKSLPADLAAEGKVKVMQIIYDLELRALNRKQFGGDSMNNTEGTIMHNTSDNQTNSSQSQSQSQSQSPHDSDRGAANTNSNSNSNSNTNSNTSSNNVNEVEDKTIYTPEIAENSTRNGPLSIMMQSRNRTENTNQRSVQLNHVSSPSSQSPQVLDNTNIKRIKLNPSVQINPRSAAGSGLRCVPLHALRPPSVPTDPKYTKIQIGGRTSLPNRMTNPGDSSGVRHIQVNSRTQTHFITVNANQQRHTVGGAASVPNGTANSHGPIAAPKQTATTPNQGNKPFGTIFVHRS